jgi:membrane fusion protein, multidrug efflux system
VLKIERAIGNRWLISDGVADGDKVIVSGLQRLKPGVAIVKPNEIPLKELNGEPAAAASAAGVGALANVQTSQKIQ